MSATFYYGSVPNFVRLCQSCNMLTMTVESVISLIHVNFDGVW